MADPVFSSPYERFDIGFLEKPSGPDQEAIADLYGQLYPDVKMGGTPINDQDAESYVVARARDTRRIAGMVQCDHSGGETWLTNLIVDIEERRKGVGEALLRFCIVDAAENGSRKARAIMQYIDFQEPGERALARLGFTHSDRGGYPSRMELVLSDA